MSPNHALVFGASGMAGWGIVNELSKSSLFHGIIGTTVRPIEDIGIAQDDRINLVSGIDLSESKKEIHSKLQGIKDIASVTHVYYAVLLPRQDIEEKCAVNIKAFHNAVELVDELCPNLEFILVQSGSVVSTPSSPLFQGSPLFSTMALSIVSMSPMIRPLRSLAIAYRFHTTTRSTSTRKWNGWLHIPKADVGNGQRPDQTCLPASCQPEVS